jgi:hypothetical protein
VLNIGLDRSIVVISGGANACVPGTPEVFPPDLINDDIFHLVDNGGLTVGAQYDVILKNAPVTSGGNPSNEVEGWLKLAATADPTSYMDGEPIIVNVPILVIPSAAKTRLSFSRNTDTPFPCQVFVNRKDQ